jgi:hypothetical protein
VLGALIPLSAGGDLDRLRRKSLRVGPTLLCTRLVTDADVSFKSPWRLQTIRPPARRYLDKALSLALAASFPSVVLSFSQNYSPLHIYDFVASSPFTI